MQGTYIKIKNPHFTDLKIVGLDHSLLLSSLGMSYDLYLVVNCRFKMV